MRSRDEVGLDCVMRSDIRRTMMEWRSAFLSVLVLGENPSFDAKVPKYRRHWCGQVRGEG
jgi:hypothetical protein